MSARREDSDERHRASRALEVFRVFLALGLTSFGGPLAHIGYFRETFVRRRAWLDETRFAHLLGLCQFLPGPASSQLGFAIGWTRAGWRGGLAAFIGFTLPSALLMFAFAKLAPTLDQGFGKAAVHGLKLVAVVVVAQGLLGMARTLTPDARRLFIAIGALLAMVLGGQAWMQLLAIALGGLLGVWWCKPVPLSADAARDLPTNRRWGLMCFALFLAGLVAALLLPSSDKPTLIALASAFYRAGALVFGGGHVVLPLLEHSVVDTQWLASDTFLAGYGAAQALPGPMFSLAAFLGAEVNTGQASALCAIVALVAIFVPGFLILLAALPTWASITRHPKASAAIAGVNAAVVGLLAAAFYDPVLREGIASWSDLAIVLAGFAMMFAKRVPALAVVAWCVLASIGVVIWR